MFLFRSLNDDPYSRAIPRQARVRRHQDQRLGQALRDQQAVERVFVMRRQTFQRQNVSQSHRQKFEAVFALLIGDEFG